MLWFLLGAAVVWYVIESIPTWADKMAELEDEEWQNRRTP